jgi:S-adenosylmethionine:tRNA ribosyltransferase-isomerase
LDFDNKNCELKLKDFNFFVPPELVAHEPLPNREESKVLIYNAPGTIKIDSVTRLPNILPKGSVLIFNNSRVFPSRLIGQLETGGKVEIFLTRKFGSSQNANLWWALGKPLRKLKIGTKISFTLEKFTTDLNGHSTPSPLMAQVMERSNNQVLLSFDTDEESLNHWLDRWGIIPLPPYIKRDHVFPASLSPDRDRYQTVFAKIRGSVAAPTAGLHFSENLLDIFREEGIRIRYVSLHVGSGTFLPVKSENISEHQMHLEPYLIPRETLEEIFQARKQGRPVIAVGTTSFRCLEDLYRISHGQEHLMLEACNQWHETNLFLYPKNRSDIYKPWIIDGIITNFHQPQSTLLMLIASLIGLDQTLSMYDHAIKNKLRLFSYGDTSLLWLK